LQRGAGVILQAIAALLALSLAGSGFLYWRLDAAQDELAAVRAAAVSAALAYSENARQIEQQHAQRVQGITDAKDATLRRVRAAAAADLDRLRDRADRVPGADIAPRPACAGATGAELSGRDAAFLVGLAERADWLRAELAACQQREHAGEVSQP
jgi:hypothetical protein